ncbi:hypothetical protein ABZ807_31310 [Micromonospora sp. NPDC047548]|uniref:hypothetical protein n=1 Tax=Micromonospora sp. NPDC047548 TaxID=3155624 RepID=UPI0033EF5DEA
MREQVSQWWNGSWGRLTRRDVWLSREVRWHIVARFGDTETGKILRWEFATEDEARSMVQRLLRAECSRELSDLMRNRFKDAPIASNYIDEIEALSRRWPSAVSPGQVKQDDHRHRAGAATHAR